MVVVVLRNYMRVNTHCRHFHRNHPQINVSKGDRISIDGKSGGDAVVSILFVDSYAPPRNVDIIFDVSLGQYLIVVRYDLEDSRPFGAFFPDVEYHLLTRSDAAGRSGRRARARRRAAGLLDAAFREANKRSLSESQLAMRLEDYLFQLRQVEGEDAFRRHAVSYLDEWVRMTSGNYRAIPCLHTGPRV